MLFMRCFRYPRTFFQEVQMILNGSEILVNVLIEQGVDTVFGYPGGAVLNIYDALYKYSDKITHYMTAHEQGASHAADGYARATGMQIDPSVFAESIHIIRESGIAHEFRTTAVKGIHTPEDFAEIGRWLGGGSSYFIQSFVDSPNLLGEGCSAFSAEETEALVNAVKPYIPEVQLRGKSS